MSEKNSYKIDRICLRRTKICLSILFQSFLTNSTLLFIFLLGLCLGNELVVYNVGLLPSQFYQVLPQKNTSTYRDLLIKSFSLIITEAVYLTAIKFVSGYLYIYWRRLLTEELHKNYFYNTTVYNVNSIEKSLDNVDQRITQDVDRFCQQLSNMSATVLIAPLKIIYYTYNCYTTTGYLGVIIIYAYFIVTTVGNRFLMSLIVPLIFKQEKCEGDFRFKHSDIRMNAESIALMKSQKIEHKRANDYLETLLAVQKRIVYKEAFLNLSTNIFDYVGSIISYIIIAIPIFAGKYEDENIVGNISKNTFFAMYLFNSFSNLTDLSLQLTDLMGYAHRIGELLEYLYQNKKWLNEEDKDGRILIKAARLKAALLTTSELSFHSPDGENLLLSSLNLSVARSENLLINGRTGCGKSSLLRVLANVWKPTQGIVKILSDKQTKNVMFVPQNAYLSNGSIFDLVIYPHSKDKLVDKKSSEIKVLEVLTTTGMIHLIDRVGGIDATPENRWENLLSNGEIQRIGFARLFYHQPILAILDEPTSSLGISEEESFYNRCEELNITLISVGHRETLKKFHKHCLHITERGSWNYTVITENSS